PQACVSAAKALPVNPSVPLSDTNGATGVQALANFGCYMSGSSVILPPAQGTFGNMTRNMLRGAGLRLWDFSVRKYTKFTEQLAAEFQFDMYNVTNSPQFAPPNSSLISPSTFG